MVTDGIDYWRQRGLGGFGAGLGFGFGVRGGGAGGLVLIRKRLTSLCT